MTEEIHEFENAGIFLGGGFGKYLQLSKTVRFYRPVSRPEYTANLECSLPGNDALRVGQDPRRAL
jgi:hypothetical protein